MKKNTFKLLCGLVIAIISTVLFITSSYATSSRNTVTNSITEEKVQEIVDEKVANAVEGAVSEIEIKNENQEQLVSSEQNKANGVGMLAAAIATGLACIGSGIAVAVVASSAVGAISEDPSLLGKTIIFAGLAEGIAIYGLIIAIMILNKI